MFAKFPRNPNKIQYDSEKLANDGTVARFALG